MGVIMLLAQAEAIAGKYFRIFEPHCTKIDVVGSVRRKKNDVHDIELLVIPKGTTVETGDMFNPTETIREPEFVKLVNSFTRVKGNGEGKYAQLILEEGINLDLFITTPEQWGVIKMIRIGSAAFSQRMVTEIKQRGYFVKDGFLWKGNKVVPTYSERDFFFKTQTEWVEPDMRYF
jgi:DNA polymerase/3'-5' exonuclease PolX